MLRYLISLWLAATSFVLLPAQVYVLNDWGLIDLAMVMKASKFALLGYYLGNVLFVVFLIAASRGLHGQAGEDAAVVWRPVAMQWGIALACLVPIIGFFWARHFVNSYLAG